MNNTKVEALYLVPKYEGEKQRNMHFITMETESFDNKENHKFLTVLQTQE